MAYNNFPMGYQPAQIFYPQQNTIQQPQNNSIIWVQGEAGAKSYMVAPNTTVQLWDSEDQVIYLKSADSSGMPSIKILDYKIREAQQPISSLNNHTDYITRDEFSEFENEIRDQVRGLMSQRCKSSKKEDKSNE